MAKNKMNEVAKLLGIELEEEFSIDGFRCKYKLTNDGLMYWSYLDSKWLISGFLKELLTGQYEIIKLPKPILDEKEKEYLSNIIKPFRNRVIYIEKCYLGDNEYIEICLKHFMGNDNCETLVLPEFEKGTMYKGMKTRKRYALEDLCL